MADLNETLKITVVTEGDAQTRALVETLKEMERNAKAAAAGADGFLTPALRRTENAAKSTARAVQQVNDGSRNMALGISNVGFQIQDFVVQVTGGTNAMRAFGQQMPQVLTAFGAGTPALSLVIATLATLAALLPSIVGLFGETANASDEATEAAKALNTALSEQSGFITKAETAYKAYVASVLEGQLKIAAAEKKVTEANVALAQDAQETTEAQLTRDAAAIAALQAEYDALIQTIAKFQVEQKQIETGTSTVKQADQAVRLVALMSGIQKLTAEAGLLGERLSDAENEFAALSAEADKSAIALDTVAARAAEIAAQTASTQQFLINTNDQTRALVDLMFGVAEAAATIAAGIVSARDAVIDLNANGVQVPAWITNATNAAAGLATTLWNAAAAAAAAALKQQETQKLAGAYGLMAFTRNQNMMPEVKGSSGGGGGAPKVTEEEKALTAALKLANEELAKSQEEAGGASREYTKLAEALKLITDAGAMTPVQLGELNKLLASMSAGAKTANEVVELAADGITSMFDDLIEGTVSVQDAFANMLTTVLQDIAKFLVSRQITSLLNLFGSAIGGSGIGNLFNTPIAPAASASAYGVSTFDGSTASATNSGQGAPRYPSNTAAMKQRSQSGVSIVINNTVSQDTDVKAKESVNANGQQQIELLVERKVKALIGSGRMDRTFEQTFGMRRKPV